MRLTIARLRRALLIAALAVAGARVGWSPLLAVVDGWTASATSTPAAIVRALLVRSRNAAAMRAYAQRLHTGRPLVGARALVTGGTSGLGRGLVGHLAIAGASLVLPHRRALSPTELEASVAQSVADVLAHSTAEAAARYDVLGLPDFDLGSFASLERAADALAAANVRVDVLINNAGLVSVRGDPTAEGFEATFGVNFVGSAYWTQLLQAKGVLAPDARIVMVGSEEHRQHVIGRQKLGAPPADASWRDAMDRYGWSKICLNAYAHELRRRWTGHAVYDVCPGPVASEIGREAPPAVARALSAVLRAVFPSPAEAALPVVRLAFDASFAADRDAAVHHHMSEARPAGGDAADADVGAWVWSETQRLIDARGP